MISVRTYYIALKWSGTTHAIECPFSYVPRTRHQSANMATHTNDESKYTTSTTDADGHIVTKHTHISMRDGIEL